MREGRRVFLRALGAGVAFVSFPEIFSIFNLLPSRPTADDDLAATLRRLFSGEEAGGGPFVTHAETVVTESTPQQLLSSPSALMQILDQFGVEKTFSKCVDYSEASQCRPYFESQEGSWRKMLGAEAIYTDVRRARAEPNVAVLVGGKVNPANNTLSHAEGSIQYQQKPAVRLAGRDAGVVLKAPAVVGQHLRLSDKELAQGLALLDKKTVEIDDGLQAQRYETALSTIVHIDRPRQHNRVGSRAVGVIAVCNKQDRHNPNNIYFSDLYE